MSLFKRCKLILANQVGTFYPQHAWQEASVMASRWRSTPHIA